jgi:hypothetical protein
MFYYKFSLRKNFMQCEESQKSLLKKNKSTLIFMFGAEAAVHYGSGYRIRDKSFLNRKNVRLSVSIFVFLYYCIFHEKQWNAGEIFNPASSVLLLSRSTLPASAFRRRLQSDTSDHGI